MKLNGVRARFEVESASEWRWVSARLRVGEGERGGDGDCFRVQGAG